MKNVSGVSQEPMHSRYVARFWAELNKAYFYAVLNPRPFSATAFRLQQGVGQQGLGQRGVGRSAERPGGHPVWQVEPGGMVNVITKQPLATPYYGFTQQFGSYDLYRTTLDASGPITKNKDLLYRVNMSYENSGSFRDLVDKEDVFLRAGPEMEHQPTNPGDLRDGI